VSHNYLLNTYHFIERKIAETNRRIDSKYPDHAEHCALLGKIEALLEFECFLKAHFDSRLPSRLRRRRNRIVGRTV
jgi:hypothetical protein